MNTKKHSAAVNGDSPQVELRNIFITVPPMIMYSTHVPPERYIVGNIASNFPSFSPALISIHLHIFNKRIKKNGTGRDGTEEVYTNRRLR